MLKNDPASAAVLLPVLLCVLIVFIVMEKKRQRNIDAEYDERQLRIRGKAAWYSVYAMMFYAMIYLLAELFFGFRMLSPAAAVFFGCMIAGSVNIGYSILKESYYGMKREGSFSVFFLVVIGAAEIICLVLLVKMIRSGSVMGMYREITDQRIYAVLCLPLLTTVLSTTIIQMVRAKEENE